jgi:hypothetical protein
MEISLTSNKNAHWPQTGMNIIARIGASTTWC